MGAGLRPEVMSGAARIVPRSRARLPGAFYGQANSPANSGSGVGYGSGPNSKGHVVKFAYSPSDSLTVSLKWFATDLITEYPVNSQSGMSRMQVDAMWKF